MSIEVSASPEVVGEPQDGGALAGGGRAECGAGLMQELVAEPRHRAGDHRTLGVGQVGLGGEEPIQLAAEDGIGVVAQLAEQRPGVSPVLQGGQAGGRLCFDDPPGAIDLRVPALEVLFGLGPKVVDRVEHHPLQRADPLFGKMQATPKLGGRHPETAAYLLEPTKPGRGDGAEVLEAFERGVQLSQPELCE